jgi:glycosyltransferase involved in cell wall biosynthesis
MAINRRVYQLFLRDGWKVELVVPTELNFPAGPKKANPPAPGDPLIHYLFLNGENPRTYSFDGLKGLLDERKPEVVLLDNDPVSLMAGVVGMWCISNGSRLFCISNENMSLKLFDALKSKGLRGIAAALLKRALIARNRSLVSGIFTINSDGEKIFLAERFSNVKRMPLGFDPTVFHPDEKARALVRDKEGLKGIVFAYFGRLTEEKGVHVLVRALKPLVHLEWQLVLDRFDEYGSLYLKTIKDEINRAGIKDKIVYIHADHFQIASYMNAVDVVVVPSITTALWKEQYGRVAAEAMACGKTVISSNSGALPDLINGNGFIFEEGNERALTGFLESFVKGELQKSSEVVAEYAQRELSINKQKEVMEGAMASW